MAGKQIDKNPKSQNPNDSDYVSKHSKLGNPDGTGQNFSAVKDSDSDASKKPGRIVTGQSGSKENQTKEHPNV